MSRSYRLSYSTLIYPVSSLLSVNKRFFSSIANGQNWEVTSTLQRVDDKVVVFGVRTYSIDVLVFFHFISFHV